MDTLRQWWLQAKSKFQTWLLSKAVVWAFQSLTAHHVGQKLNQAMDQQFGKERSDVVQNELAKWLHQVAQELDA